MANGLGFAQEEEETPVRTVDALGQQAVGEQKLETAQQVSRGTGFGSTLRRAGKSIKENPFESLGLILSNVAAGIQGRELPTTRLAQQRLETEAFQQKRVKAGIDMTNAILTAAGKAPEGQQQRVLDTLTEQVAEQFPEVATFLSDSELTFNEKVDFSNTLKGAPRWFKNMGASGEVGMEKISNFICD